MDTFTHANTNKMRNQMLTVLRAHNWDTREWERTGTASARLIKDGTMARYYDYAGRVIKTVRVN